VNGGGGVKVGTHENAPWHVAKCTKQEHTQSYVPSYNVLKIRQISEKIKEEVPWRENFPVIRGNDDYFPRITGKFFPTGDVLLFTYENLPDFWDRVG
jgi:hypothetical protein